MDVIVGTQTEPSLEVVEVKKSTEALPTTPEESSLPPSLRTKENQLPLIVDILGAKPYYDSFNTKDLSERIDTYINGEISRRGLKDTAEVYKDMINEVSKKINLPENATIWVKLEKIAEYLRINQKLVDALKEREDVLTGDPLSLSSAQLRRRLELNGHA